MRSGFLRLALIVAAAAFLAGWAGTAEAATITVNVNSNFFSPSDVTVNVGDTVQWVWVEGAHTTTSSDGLWDSGIQSAGSTFQFTFNQAGDFKYICTIHFQCCNMAGTVHVSPAVGTVAALLVSAPSNVSAGSPFDVTVTAVDANGNTVTGYTGTVAFSSTDPFPAVLPANYTFTANDQGTHTFSGGVTLFTAGAQTLTVQDTTNTSLTGSATVSVGAGALARLTLSAPAAATAGSAFNVTVTAVDSNGNVVTGYTGTVTFTSLEANPQPTDYTFTASDNGSHVFAATLFTAGAETLLARDAVNEALTGTATVNVQAAPASHFLLIAPESASSGTPFDLIVAALDPYGNFDMNYQGTVAFTTTDTDPGVMLPAAYTWTSGNNEDNGLHDFVGGVTLITSGQQTLTVTDTVSAITGSATLTVGAGP
jgi:plastocyanin